MKVDSSTNLDNLQLDLYLIKPTAKTIYISFINTETFGTNFQHLNTLFPESVKNNTVSRQFHHIKHINHKNNVSVVPGILSTRNSSLQTFKSTFFVVPSQSQNKPDVIVSVKQLFLTHLKEFSAPLLS